MKNEFIVMLNGKPFVTYEGLLYAAHEKGLQSIEVELMQYPTEENKFTCMTRANVRGADGSVFSDIGDSSPASCNSKIIPHLIRMASTRAKARALRDFTNTGICSIEELGEGELSSKASPLKMVK